MNKWRTVPMVTKYVGVISCVFVVIRVWRHPQSGFARVWARACYELVGLVPALLITAVLAWALTWVVRSFLSDDTGGQSANRRTGEWIFAVVYTFLLLDLLVYWP